MRRLAEIAINAKEQNRMKSVNSSVMNYGGPLEFRIVSWRADFRQIKQSYTKKQ